ncbi:SulP family sulfate permease [Isoptericola sp. CG 20/1183]|uniref:SulP family sulfate permease n=1 Tax=Isoptericola halotolerans TaxID=300560 RepID=A0ABX5EDL3_9MICO|nr:MULTISPECIES: solute carrier family 23 protein [Isoptericola]PRZ05752.1 SulP family sulfate permease [Isoptericola halotolerans]PRZ06320.1 SulP family sulfate permease [Isoptericola sp. CG 20/1183]
MSDETDAADESGASRERRRRPTVRDVVSGFVTGLFSIPEGMAYATVGGFAAPLGLWSGAVPTIVGSLFSRTVLMVTTLTSAIVLTANSVLADAGLDPGDLGAVATMTLLVGAWMILLGVLRLGAVMSFVSTAVMTGFTAGIAVQIVAGVVKDATGYVPESSNTVGKLLEALWHVGDWDGATVAVAAATVGLWALLGLVRPLRKVATLVSLVVVTVVVTVTGLAVERVSDIAAIPRSLPPFTLPDLAAMPALATGSLAIALVALAQAAGIGAAVPNPDGSRTDVSKDFTAQGLANVAGGFFGALPTGGSLSRTGVATTGGAQTRWAGIFAGAWLVVLVLLLGPSAGAIPMAVIGGLLLVIGGELVAGRVADVRLVLRTSTLSSVAMVVTFAATTQLPLQQAIFLGAGLSIVLFAVQVARRGRIVELVPTGDGDDFRIAEVPATLPSGRTTVLHYVGTGFFAEVNRLEEEWPHTSGTRDAGLVVSLRGSAGIPSTTFLKSLDRLIDRWHARGVEVVLCGVPDDLRRRLDTGGVTDRLAGSIVSDSGGVLASVREAYELVERRRQERAAPDADPGVDPKTGTEKENP